LSVERAPLEGDRTIGVSNVAKPSGSFGAELIVRVTVFGLWHLGCVTAACLAEAGHSVIGLDFDNRVIDDLLHGRPPIDEPGLTALLQAGQARGTLSFTADAAAALRACEVLWVTFDTPVNDADEADVAWVRQQFEAIAPALKPGTTVLISSQVPVGFTGALEKALAGRGLQFAVSPENLRLGKALACFQNPERIVVGCRNEPTRTTLKSLLEPFCGNLLWMGVESAEMTKHAVNSFLALSVTFINELARLCEMVGADAKEVELGLKSESRIGPKAYVSPGAAFAGGTLARDIRFLIDLGQHWDVAAPLFRGVWESNDEHKDWIRKKLTCVLRGVAQPVVAVLGLTYKPGTNTLRRSSSIELCRWLGEQKIHVKGHDPALAVLPADLDKVVELCLHPAAALTGSDVAIIATEWPEFKSLNAGAFVSTMRRPHIIDQNHFLAASLAGDSGVCYHATGKPVTADHVLAQDSPNANAA
jgi:UDPglucose 6-dehydrogenase